MNADVAANTTRLCKNTIAAEQALREAIRLADVSPTCMFQPGLDRNGNIAERTISFGRRP